MARHVLPLVLLLVALVVRLILSAPVPDPDSEQSNISEVLKVQHSIFSGLGPNPCRKKCYKRDFLGRCRLNFTCMFG
ncbi:hypothetical protein O3P69_020511 [Scylla paramamosain]|uniref:Uncharacterized protein n=1 Tax=Scylla paramamosain TaxID=85552 RepID=A0AAW0TLF8_SCYPA|nr:antimicrobial peptide sparamosin [Scylla paramamosain]